MSEVSKVISDRDRARLQFKESVKELTAARGQEDDVIDKLIVKVNEAFDVLLNSHVELVLNLGEDLSDEIHENFMYEASDEKDEAVEEAEKEKIGAKKIAREEIVTEEGLGGNNLELSGRKDRKEFFDRKLMISCKVSPEVARMGLSQMFSAGTILKALFPIAVLQGEFGPQEASRMVIHVELSAKIEDERVAGYVVNKSGVEVQKEIKLSDEGGEAAEIFNAVKIIDASMAFPSIDEYKSKMESGLESKHVSSQLVYGYDIGDAVLLKKLDKPPDTSVKGEVFQSMPGVEQLSGSLRQVKDFIKFKVPGHAHIKNGVGDSVLFTQYDYVVMSYEDSGPLTKYNRIKMPGAICREEKYGAFNREELNFLFKHMDDKLNLERQFGGLKHVRNLAKLKLSGDAYINRCFGSIAENMDFLNEHKYSMEYRADKRVYSGRYKVVGAGGVRLKCLLEQLYGGVSQMEVPDGHMLIEYAVYINRYKADVLIHSQGFNDKEFMHHEKCENVFRHAYIERCAGSIVIVTKCGFNKKGVRGSNLLVQYAYIVRRYENIVPLVKHGKHKVSEAICLKEKQGTFNREKLNILLKHMDDKLKLEWQASNLQQARIIAKLKLTGTIYLERRAGGITLIVKAEFSRKGIGDSSLFERSVFIARSSVDTVPVFKDNKLKVPEASVSRRKILRSEKL